MKNLNFKERIAKINEQRQRLALAKTDEESQISQEASNDPDVLNDGPHASFELTEKISFGEEVKAEVSNEGKPFNQRQLTMKELLLEKNKDNPLKLIQISQKAKNPSVKEMLAERADSKKHRALADAKSMLEEEQSIADCEEESAECETFDETSGASETSMPEVHSISNDSDVRTVGLHTCKEVAEQASHSEVVISEIADEVEPTKETLPSMKEILLQKSKEKALRLVAVPQGKKPTLMRRMLDENKARKERRALAEARAKAEEQESIDDDEYGSAEVTTYEDTPADHESTSSPEMDSMPQYPMTSLTAGRYLDQDQDQQQEHVERQSVAQEATQLTVNEVDAFNYVKPGLNESGVLVYGQATAPTSPLRGKKRPYPTHAFGPIAETILVMAKANQVNPQMVGDTVIGIGSAIAQPLINVSSQDSGKGCPVTLNMFIIAESGGRKSSTLAVVAEPLYAALRRATDARRDMIVHDVTVDGMVSGLIYRSWSQLLLAPEGAALLGGHAMSKDNLNRFLGIVSALFSGETIARTRVKEHITALDRRLSVLLFCQPIVAMGFLSSELVMQQGFGNRFLYSQPSSLPGAREYVNINLLNEPTYIDYCKKITALAVQDWKTDPDTDGVDPRIVRMSPKAKAAWVFFYNALARAVDIGGTLEAHKSYVTRMPEQVMRLAGVLAILEDPEVTVIQEDVMLRAIDLGDYYLYSAIDLFNLAPANQDELEASILLDWMKIKQRDFAIPAIPLRMIYKDGPRCARLLKRAKELLALLEARGEVNHHAQTVRYGNGNRSGNNYAVV